MRFTTLLIAFLLPLTAASQVSRNGAFTAVTERIGGAKSHPEFNTWTVAVKNSAGAVQYRLVRDVPFDAPYPSIALLDNGGIIIANAFFGTVDFYSNSGNLLNTILPLGKVTAEHEQIIKVSTAGNRVAVLVSSPHRPTAELTIYDETGRSLWSSSLDGMHAAELFLSDDAAITVAGVYTMKESLQSQTHVFDRGGLAIMQMPGDFRCADVANGYVALGERNTVYFFALGDSRPRFSWSTPSPLHIVTNVKIAGVHTVSAVEKIELFDGVPTYINPSLVVLDSSGLLVARRDITSASASPATLMLVGNMAILSAGDGSESASLNVR